MSLVCATDTRTLWIRRSLSHSLRARMIAAPTSYRYRDRSHRYHAAVGRAYKRAEKPGNFVLPPIRPMFAQNMPCKSSGSKLMDWTMASPNPAWCNPTIHDVICLPCFARRRAYLCGLGRRRPRELKSVRYPYRVFALRQRAGR